MSPEAEAVRSAQQEKNFEVAQMYLSLSCTNSEVPRPLPTQETALKGLKQENAEEGVVDRAAEPKSNEIRRFALPIRDIYGIGTKHEGHQAHLRKANTIVVRKGSREISSEWKGNILNNLSAFDMKYPLARYFDEEARDTCSGWLFLNCIDYPNLVGRISQLMDLVIGYDSAIKKNKLPFRQIVLPVAAPKCLDDSAPRDAPAANNPPSLSSSFSDNESTHSVDAVFDIPTETGEETYLFERSSANRAYVGGEGSSSRTPLPPSKTSAGRARKRGRADRSASPTKDPQENNDDGAGKNLKSERNRSPGNRLEFACLFYKRYDQYGFDAKCWGKSWRDVRTLIRHHLETHLNFDHGLDKEKHKKLIRLKANFSLPSEYKEYWIAAYMELFHVDEKDRSKIPSPYSVLPLSNFEPTEIQAVVLENVARNPSSSIEVVTYANESNVLKRERDRDRDRLRQAHHTRKIQLMNELDSKCRLELDAAEEKLDLVYDQKQQNLNEQFKASLPSGQRPPNNPELMASTIALGQQSSRHPRTDVACDRSNQLPPAWRHSAFPTPLSFGGAETLEISPIAPNIRDVLFSEQPMPPGPYLAEPHNSSSSINPAESSERLSQRSSAAVSQVHASSQEALNFSRAHLLHDQHAANISQRDYDTSSSPFPRSDESGYASFPTATPCPLFGGACVGFCEYGTKCQADYTSTMGEL